MTPPSENQKLDSKQFQVGLQEEREKEKKKGKEKEKGKRKRKKERYSLWALLEGFDDNLSGKIDPITGL